MSQSPSDIRRMLAEAGVQARKTHGQHFLADANLIDKIVRLADVAPGEKVLEVGAGTGALTVALAERGAVVVAYEIDRRLAPILANTLEGLEVDLRFEDITEADLPFDESRWKVVANLPYNIGTPLVLDILRKEPAVQSLTIMIQKEVAERLIAEVGSQAYGFPSVVVGLTATPIESFVVPPQVFVPPPRVGSMVVRLDRKKEVSPRLEGALRLARSSFGQRRKMLRKSLDLEPAVFARAGVPETARPEELSGQDFVRLAEAADG